MMGDSLDYKQVCQENVTSSYSNSTLLQQCFLFAELGLEGGPTLGQDASHLKLANLTLRCVI